MRGKRGMLSAAAILSALAAIVLTARGDVEKKPAAVDKDNDADRAAIRAASQAFVAAFSKGDAKAVATLWTERGECHEANGAILVGREALEKGFAEYFEKNPKTKIQVIIKSIRFPAPDLAIEEGLLRLTASDKDLPSTTLYSATHVRSGGTWKMAISREWGADQDRIEDLDWLIGSWKAAAQDQEVSLTFSRDSKSPFLHGKFTKKSTGKITFSGTMKIGVDPQRRQLRSWHFDDDGGHGSALWVRDRNNWVLDSHGVQGDGTPVASVNLLGRLSDNEITWRSIDRVLGDHELPDTVPIKLTRVK